jgi:hypothetical protein
MTTENTRIRFANNNFLVAGATITSSTFNTSYPIANIYDSRRGVYGSFRGNFLVVSTNKKIYINDGSAKTITLTEAEYTGATLASHIQTQLNASSSNWTCTYSSTTYKFTISRSSGTDDLVLSTTTDAAWDLLGITGSVQTTCPYTSDESRIHSHEWILVDLGLQHEIGLAGLVGPLGTELGLSATATVKIQGNNVDSWSAPTVDMAMSVNDIGSFAFPDATHRYWRLYIQDRENTDGPTALKIGSASISSTVELTSVNIANGFTMGFQDNADVFVSDSGARYFNTKPKPFYLSGELQAAFGSQRRELEQFFFDFGVSEPFFISIDPKLCVFANHTEVTKLVRFSEMPSLQHIIRDYFNVSLSVIEVV